jgi:hypothetical protein
MKEGEKLTSGRAQVTRGPFFVRTEETRREIEKRRRADGTNPQSEREIVGGEEVTGGRRGKNRGEREEAREERAELEPKAGLL